MPAKKPFRSTQPAPTGSGPSLPAEVSPVISQALDLAEQAARAQTPPAAEARLPHNIPMARIEEAPRKAPRSKDSHFSGPKAVFRCIPDKLKEKLDHLADELHAPVGLIARFFFDYGLEDFGKGLVPLRVYTSTTGLTLFPAEERKTGRPTNSSRPEKRPKTVAFHGVPAELVAGIRAIAEEHHVKNGEVARLLLEYGLEMHRAQERPLSHETVIQYARFAYRLPQESPEHPPAPPLPRPSPAKTK